MCGIAAYIGPGPFDPAPFLQSLAHRGPDARGIWSTAAGSDNRVHLVHTRLSILDLSPAGNQPMVLHRGAGEKVTSDRWSVTSGQSDVRTKAEQLRRPGTGDQPSGWAGGTRDAFAIVFNGEIYNFRELRTELEGCGHTFRSMGDTEVLLRGYAEWGRDVFSKLDGIFAVVICDGPGHRLVVARDHVGIKPLYYCRSRDGGFLFASQVRALAACGLWDGAVNRPAILDYLRFGSFQEPATVFTGIWALESGCMGWIDLDEGVPGILRTKCYWPIERVAENGAQHDWHIAHSELLRRTVTEQLVADVPIGVFLSGGLDSTLLLELAAATARDRLTAFTVGGELTTNDEASVAARTATNLGVRHVLVRLTRAEREDCVRQSLGAMDQPSCDGVNSYVVSRASRAAGLVVALGGTGADELHGAYGHAANLSRLNRLTERFGLFSRLFGPTAARVIGAVRGPVAGERLALMLQQARFPWRLVQERRRFFTPDQIADLWPEGKSILVEWRSPVEDETDLAGLSAELQITIAEVRGYLLNTLLRDSDWATMANQQEFRVPYLGRHYVEFMLGMPAALKYPMGPIKKPLLAEMITPPNRDLVSLRKRGFTLNYAGMLLGSLREEFCADCKWLDDHLGFRIDATARLKELQASHSSKIANRLWAFLALGNYLSRLGQ